VFICSTAGKNIIGSKKVRTALAFPFEVIKPCSFSGDITLNDINKKIHAPPPDKIRHKSDDEPNSLEASAMMVKHVFHKTKMHTEGERGPSRSPELEAKLTIWDASTMAMLIIVSPLHLWLYGCVPSWACGRRDVVWAQKRHSLDGHGHRWIGS
jgi:hypothetical protein